MEKKGISVYLNAMKFPGLHAALGIDMKPRVILQVADTINAE